MASLHRREYWSYIAFESACEECEVSLCLGTGHSLLDFVLGHPARRRLLREMLIEWEFGSLSANHELKHVSLPAAGLDYVLSCHC